MGAAGEEFVLAFGIRGTAGARTRFRRKHHEHVVERLSGQGHLATDARLVVGPATG